MPDSRSDKEQQTTRQPAADLPTLERMFRVLLESSEDGILVFDREMHVLFVNCACERLIGQTREAILGGTRTCGELTGCHNEFGQSKSSGETCPVLRLFGENPPPFVSHEMMIDRVESGEIWIESRYFPVRGDSGQADYVIGVLRDISERKATEEQLLESRKLASFGILTAGIAHELKNPLGILRSAAEIIAGPEEGEDARREAAEFIKTETMRLDRIIRQFLAYARPNPPDLAQTDLNEVVDYTIDMFTTREEHPAGIHVKKQIAHDLPRCWIDSAQIHQVLLNLLLNAESAGGEEGTIVISTRRDGDWVTLEVGDSGPGIEPASVERVFDPFFTTRPEGSGLGLAVVRRIVTEHRGRIKVDRSPLGGSAFAIRLPMHTADRPIPVEIDPSVPPTGAGGKIALRRRNADKGKT